MRALPKGIDPADLPDLAHYRGHGVDRINAWCLTPLCHHQAALTFDQLREHGAKDSSKLWDLGRRLRCTVCGRQNADVQPDWSQKSKGHGTASTWGTMPHA